MKEKLEELLEKYAAENKKSIDRARVKVEKGDLSANAYFEGKKAVYKSVCDDLYELLKRM